VCWERGERGERGVGEVGEGTPNAKM